MYSEKQLCEKIIAINPGIGRCGSDINVTFNKQEDSFVVHLKEDTHSLDHFLNLLNANRCMEGKQCIALGLEIAQLRNNLEGKQF